MLWLPLLLACSTPTPPATVEEAPAVQAPARSEPYQHAVVIVIDTLRADAVERAHTPNIDALAAQGSRASHAWSAGTWTLPSTVSLFTGMHVRQHGWNLETGQAGSYPPLPQTPTLPEVLSKHGFVTEGLYANNFVSGQLGFDRGFDRYAKVPDSHVVERFAGQVEQWDPSKRHFAYLHLLGPHSPLKPSAEAAARWKLDPKWTALHNLGLLIGEAKRNQKPGVRDAYSRAYHAVVEDTDARVGQLLEALGEHRDDTLVVLTSDHGELLGEHNVVGHGWWVWQQLTHVPLVANVAVPEVTTNAIVPALVTSNLGIEHAWPVGLDDATPLVAYRSEKFAFSPKGETKWVHHDSDQLYQLDTDPSESQPGEVPAALRQAWAAWQDATPAASIEGDAVHLHPDTREALRAMGYIDD